MAIANRDTQRANMRRPTVGAGCFWGAGTP